MGVTSHRYEVAGWGVGELWLRGCTIVQHELPSQGLCGAAQPRREDDHPRPALAPPAGPGKPRALDPVSPQGGTSRPAGTLATAGSREGAAFASDLCRRFTEHLAGARTSYEDVELALEGATPLQRDLAAAARTVPWGEVATYGELAALAGRPGAARAAGAFCAGNRFSLVIPCHRIVAADGLGGYGSGGVALKRRLLALEGVSQ